MIPLFDGDLLKKHEECNKKFSVQTTLVLCIRYDRVLPDFFGTSKFA